MVKYIEDNGRKATIEFEEMSKQFDENDTNSYIEPLTDEYDLYYIRAPMKLGKTGALLEFISDYHEPDD